MPRGKSSFKKGDVRRAVEAVKAAGEHVARVEVGADGKVIVVTGRPGERCDNNVNEWDQVLKRGAP
jgi:hypothetical protein